MEKTELTIDKDLEKNWDQVMKAITEELRDLEDEGTELPILHAKRDDARLEDIPDKVRVEVIYKRNVQEEELGGIGTGNEQVMGECDSDGEEELVEQHGGKEIAWCR